MHVRGLIVRRNTKRVLEIALASILTIVLTTTLAVPALAAGTTKLVSPDETKDLDNDPKIPCEFKLAFTGYVTTDDDPVYWQIQAAGDTLDDNPPADSDVLGQGSTLVTADPTFSATINIEDALIPEYGTGVGYHVRLFLDDDLDDTANEFGAGNKNFETFVDCIPPTTQCSDNQDNDGGGLTDLNDPGCTNAADNDETGECQDNADNDGDDDEDFDGDSGAVDADADCDGDQNGDGDDTDTGDVPNAEDTDESAQCADTIDNDGGGSTDHPADPGCAAANQGETESFDDSEVGQCQDTVDNDGDDDIDLVDSTCPNSEDPTEDGAGECDNNIDDDGDNDGIDENDPDCDGPDDSETPECDDGADNDGGGAIDLADAGCTDATDDDETSQCQDDVDNDNDRRIDFDGPGNPDSGCTSLEDNSELTSGGGGGGGLNECEDNRDNDGDGLEDFPADPGCTDENDDSELDDPTPTPVVTPTELPARPFRCARAAERLGIPLVVGTKGVDLLQGTAASEVICAKAGSDFIFGGGGADIIWAGAGNDYIEAGAGRDVVRGQRGADVALLGGGNDTVTLGRGADQATAGAGNDNVYGQEQNDSLLGGAGDDKVYGGKGSDACGGGGGTDIVGGCES